MSMEQKLIVLSTGGTGGHMFPAAALARDLISRGYRVEIVADDRGRKYESSFGGAKFHVIRAGTLVGGVAGKLTGMAKISVGMIQAFRLMDRLKPAVVVGFGGYPSVPALYAAQAKRIPTVIHEQNAIMGRANAFLAPKVIRIALSLPYTEGLDEADTMRAVVTGNPVREDIAALYTRPYPVLEKDGSFRILVMGGSQGANIFAEVVPAALAKLPAAHRARLEVTQQCREEDISFVRGVYEQAGIKAHLETFIADIATALTQAHLVISRSGASTVAEVTASGRPAIFVPYPYNRDNQQKINADVVADAGGAWVMTQNGFTAEALLPRMETFMQNSETLFRAAEGARSCGKPDAARRLGNLVTAIASGWEKEKFQ
ncbi:MAG: undecaprenyldiphospho-muramoylpentapeptide beta-N-acetylglucosaminyltransferase [Proteobacteria bacterium]|nr:undecaprenyldiphospho-muramoylpentapeptide beta-N-acetylglucosaminyltransferase [Pseudomonadota bacterium]